MSKLKLEKADSRKNDKQDHFPIWIQRTSFNEWEKSGYKCHLDKQMAIWKTEVYISHHRTGKIKIYSRFKCKKINHILKDYTEQFFYIIIVDKGQQWLKINKA